MKNVVLVFYGMCAPLLRACVCLSDVVLFTFSFAVMQCVRECDSVFEACRQPASCLFLKMCIWGEKREKLASTGPSAYAGMKGSTDRMTQNTAAVSHNYSCSIAFNYY